MVGLIHRDPSLASSRRFDVIVIGGGIHGICISLEAARRGLTSLLLERDDFGSATTWNSMRIIHGGLRYLQSMNLRRHRESVKERSWFLRDFPDLVKPLPCIMPLDGCGLRRPRVMGLALWLNDRLSARRNEGLEFRQRLEDSQILNEEHLRHVCPRIGYNGAHGAAHWNDAVMISPQRVVMEMLRAAHQHEPGAISLNYTEVTTILTQRRKGRPAVAGVMAIDRLTHEPLEFRASHVINAAGPWCCDVASIHNRSDASTETDHLEPHRKQLFRPSLAYNLLIDRPAIFSGAIAVRSGRAGGRVYFIHNEVRGGVLVGTEHAPVTMHGRSRPMPLSSEQIAYTLSEVSRAVPGWDLTERDVLRVYWGFLPVRQFGSVNLATREVLLDHSQCGGPSGFYSVSGVKFTTARRTAEKAIQRAFPSRVATPFVRAVSNYGLDLCSPEQLLAIEDRDATKALKRLIATEAIVTLDDLILRRTGWADDPRIEEAVRQRVMQLLHKPPENLRVSTPHQQRAIVHIAPRVIRDLQHKSF